MALRVEGISLEGNINDNVEGVQGVRRLEAVFITV